jgi:Fe-S cluster assembly ATP-binding protein
MDPVKKHTGFLSPDSDYEVLMVQLNTGKDLIDMSPEQRAARGLFLAFQYPWKFRDNTGNFIKTAVMKYANCGEAPDGAGLSQR